MTYMTYMYVHTRGVIAFLAWSRDMHIHDLSTGRPGWCALYYD